MDLVPHSSVHDYVVSNSMICAGSTTTTDDASSLLKRIHEGLESRDAPSTFTIRQLDDIFRTIMHPLVNGNCTGACYGERTESFSYRIAIVFETATLSVCLLFENARCDGRGRWQTRFILYHDVSHPTGFRVLDVLLRHAKKTRPSTTRKKVKAWADAEETYTLHKPVKRRFRRNRVFVKGIDDQWQADLLDVKLLMRFNNGFHYLLTFIDIFPKYN